MDKHSIRMIISQQDIQERIEQLAGKINADFSGKCITLICILKGAVFFAAELAKHLTVPVELEFMKVSSYGNNTVHGKELLIQQDIDTDIEGKNIIVVDDILDTGNTLFRLKEVLSKRNPSSITICTLLDKPSRREKEIKADYSCFEIPNEFVVGYGMDYAQYYRNLPYIGIVEFE